MKQILFLLFIIVMCGCTADRTEPLPQIKDVVGTWQLTELGRSENGETIWSEIETADKPHFFSIRFDGVLLDDKDLPLCCAPQSLKVNGVPFTIEPKAAVPVNPLCIAVSCMQCTNWQIEQTGDQMIITTCGSSPKSKYVRK